MNNLKLNIKSIPIDKINPNQYNPNKMNDAQFLGLKKNINDNGYLQPIIVMKEGDEYTILDGEHRYNAIKLLKDSSIKEIECVLVEDEKILISEPRQQLLTLSMNNIHGYNDKELLKDNIANMKLEIPEVEIIETLPNLDISELYLDIDLQDEDKDITIDDNGVDTIQYTLYIPSDIESSFNDDIEKLLMRYPKVKIKRQEND
jgi:hypothetical protein